MTLVELDESDAGAAAEVAAGDRVEVRLAENPTTGYQWQWRLPPAVRELADEHVPAPPGRPGQGGARRLLAEVADDAPAGEHRLRAELRRPWEDDPRQTLDFTLRIH